MEIRKLTQEEYGAAHRGGCPCRRTHCERHGSCAACREYHRTVKKIPVACERPIRDEKRKQRRRERMEDRA